MSEIMDGGCRFERVRRNAYWNNAHLDTRFRVAKDCTDDAINHLIDCKENPTIGLLARKNTAQIIIRIALREILKIYINSNK